MFVLVEEASWLTFCQLFFLASFIGFLVFALRSLKALRLFVVGSLLNFCKAALRRQIAILQSSLNQGVLCLFEFEVLAIVSSAMEMKVSVK